METVKLLYIDDSIDSYISQYLDEEYVYEGLNIEYLERTFNTKDTYESLLEDSSTHYADIIIIDSMLFENANLQNYKLTGEEFQIILKKVFPFKEVIVVTQNDIDEEYKAIKKFDTSADSDSKTFFTEKWKPILDEAVERVKLCRKLLKRIKEKNYLETYFFEELQQSLQGENIYSKLTVDHIDELIDKFEEIKNAYENKGL